MKDTSTDPRGPERTIAVVDAGTAATVLTLAPCGHRREFNQIYTYRVGDRARCYQCGVEARAEVARQEFGR